MTHPLEKNKSSGEYGCSHCLQPGKQLAVGIKGSTHVYPYIINNPTGPK